MEFPDDRGDSGTYDTSQVQPCVPLPCPTGIAHPSVLSSVYLLVFLAICTWWACHFPISTLGFNRLCAAVGCFGTGHLLSLYCYQTPLAQALLPPAGIWAR